MASGGSRKVIIAALLGNSAIAVTKFFAAFVTGSSAMFSEGIHSLVDTGNQVLLLHGLKRAKQPPSDKYPFGHGKEIYFWSFVVAILIFAVGAGISIYEGVHRIADPSEIRNPIVNYVVLGLAIMFEGAAWYYAFREFNRARGNYGYIEAVKRGKDPALFVVLFEDSAAMLGLLVALVAVWLVQVTGNPIYDGIASVMIGCILACTAVWLAYETKGLLIGERASVDTIRSIRSIVESYAEVEKVNELLTMHMGPEFILVNISIRFRRGQMTRQLEAVIDDIDHNIKQNHPQVKRIFIEAESS